MATPLLIGVGAVTAAVAARHLMRNGALGFGKKVGQELAKGGFKSKMDRAEAIEILGLKDTVAGRAKLRDAHRQIMLANHPDRGGSPYIASKINEARDLIEKMDKRS
ncbi:mitochondrial import inner membrane translocase subunit TIM14 [Serendipita sp. 399]|nr:mitochondrial import inner membrane translocase subunit TIM14 [Serendipita sp. 399]